MNKNNKKTVGALKEEGFSFVDGTDDFTLSNGVQTWKEVWTENGNGLWAGSIDDTDNLLCEQVV